MTTPTPPPASKSAPIASTDDRLTFPPFPKPPDGVTIVPFKNFNENGIRMFPLSNDDVELDGLGIPTVALRVRHDRDMCKTETTRKKNPKKGKHSKSSNFRATNKEWWEVWEEGEEFRMSGPYNPNSSFLDRLYEATSDFKGGRTWPTSVLGISANWDQFRLFIGVLSNTPVWIRTDKPPKEGDLDSDDEDELDADLANATDPKMDVVDVQSELGPKTFPHRPRPRPPYALYGVDPIPVGSDAEVKHLIDKENTHREENMVDFLNDPEERIRIFLSSYMRKQGLVWYDRNLVNFPRLVGFYINFLLRNRVFTEPSIDRGLRRALQVVNVAQKELILTSKLSKELPDKFSQACKSCWGQKADGYKPVFPAGEEPSQTNDSQDKANEDTRLPDPEKTQLDPVEQFEKELKASDMQVVNIDDDALMADGRMREVLKDNLDPDTIAAISGGSTSGWGSWGDDSVTDIPMVPSDPWVTPAAVWESPEIHSLIPLMGPTALPITHTTGIVEWSMRRIKSVSPPPAPGTLPKSPVSEEDPDAVDIELERRFAKVVLEPWIGWDRDEVPHLAHPRILETSRGPVAGVVKEDGRVEVSGDVAAAAVIPEGGVKPHDPFKDDITLLVDPTVLSVISIGLGLGGTWVQMARGQDLSGEGPKKKKKKSKSKQAPQRYWYVDELLMILPSYYT